MAPLHNVTIFKQDIIEPGATKTMAISDLEAINDSTRR